MHPSTHVVDNRVFLFGLDELYREAMKPHERGELLDCAQRVAGVLGVAPADVPIEGYYDEDEDLVLYFRLMRAIQGMPLEREPEVAGLEEFHRLYQVASSPVFGPPWREHLLPQGADPLSVALLEGKKPDDWTLVRLMAAAARTARATDDYSLVGLAAFAEDPVVVTALRESVVLYALGVELSALPTAKPEYLWRVDDALARRAARFVSTFNELFQERLPAPTPANAALYWGASDPDQVVGRCVRLGQFKKDGPFYHWAIQRSTDGLLAVHEFWHEEIWTTARYRARDSLPRQKPDWVPRWNQRMSDSGPAPA